MKRVFCLSILIYFFCVSTFAQNLQKKAEENPLDCALFLILAETDLDSYGRGSDLRHLANYYWKANRQIDAIKTIELISDEDTKTNERIRYAEEYIKIGKTKEASQLFMKASQSIEKDSNGNGTQVQNLVSSLIKLGEIQTAINFAESLEDSQDKAFALTKAAELIAVNGNKEKAFKLLSQATEFADSSEWQDLKLFAFLKIANVYAQNAEQEKANQLIEKVLSNYESAEFSNVHKEDFNDLIVECYVNLKEFEKALNLLQVNVNLDKEEDLYKLARLHLKAGNREKSDALFLQIEQMQDQADHSGGYILTKVIEESLITNSYFAALDSAKKISSEYYQLKIVDQFLKLEREDLASELLADILRKIKKIRANEPETAPMSTSPQMQKASDLHEVAKRFIAMKQFSAASNIISLIEKPYYKAFALTNLAEAQKTKSSSQLLNQALVIARETHKSSLDAGKFQVWCEIAAGFASIGQKDKSSAVFAEILSDKDIEVDGYLPMVGYYFEKSGLKADAKVRNALRQIIKNREDED